jgi:hypothetical protein
MKKLFFILFVIMVSCSGKDDKIVEIDLQKEISYRDSLFKFIISNKNKFKELPLVTFESDSTSDYLYLSAYLEGDKLKFFHQQYSESNELLEDYFVADEAEDLIFVNSRGFNPNTKQKNFERKIYFQKDNPKPIKDTLIGNKKDLQSAEEFYNNFYELLEAMEIKLTDEPKN